MSSLKSVEHFVLLMKENRAFDHYYGSMKGVQGFSDLTMDIAAIRIQKIVTFVLPLVWTLTGIVVVLLGGYTVHRWILTRRRGYLPLKDGGGGGGGWRKWKCELAGGFILLCLIGCLIFLYIVRSDITLPIRGPDIFDKTLHPFDASDDPACCYRGPFGISAYASVRKNGWAALLKENPVALAYLTEKAIPFYRALADGFLIGDHYYQSSRTPTVPNRLYWMSGTAGQHVTGTNSVDGNAPAFTWEPLSQTLDKKGVSWMVLQEVDNDNDNAFVWFSYRSPSGNDTRIVENGPREFERLVAADALPAITWIVAPMFYSEHPPATPAMGEWYTAQLIDTLKKHPSVYAKTVFIIDYDEGGGFYDHMWMPTPPMSTQDVSHYGYASEISADGEPMGFGSRVPLHIISPWTRGPILFSEISDHTSIIRLLEARFNFTCPNISPWRRAISSTFEGAFDWEHPDYSWPELPKVSHKWCIEDKDVDIPDTSHPPVQDPGTRNRRPLPYVARIRQLGGGFVTMRNTGKVPLYLFGTDHVDASTRSFLLAPGEEVTSRWLHGVTVRGAGGFIWSTVPEVE